MNHITPYELKLLLHYHVTPMPHPDRHLSLNSSVTVKFLELGVIEPMVAEEGYKTTPLGAAWVKAICSTPIPTTAFIDRSGKVIE